MTENKRTAESLAWLGLGPAAVVVALIIGLLVDTGVFAVITATGGMETVLWATARLFGFLIVAVAAHAGVVRVQRSNRGS